MDGEGLLALTLTLGVTCVSINSICGNQHNVEPMIVGALSVNIVLQYTITSVTIVLR